MDTKKATMRGVMIGSLVGGAIPSLWGDNPLGLSSVIFSAIGGTLGIWIAYRLVN
jgi:uncharacterized membrane protein YeaQ/YmgE (transglycosylase-associated protein family)